jgi:type IV pilus assembly protein PilQ
VIELDALVEYQVLEGSQQVRVVLRNSGGDFTPWNAGTSASTGAEVQALSVSQPPPPPQESDRIQVTFSNTPIAEVLFHFAEFANRSIVPGAAVAGLVNAEIRDQPWEEALEVILSSYGFVAREMDSGIIRVDNLENLRLREETEPVGTKAFAIN